MGHPSGPIEPNQRLREAILARINQAGIDGTGVPTVALGDIYAQALEDIAGLIHRFPEG